LTNDHGLYQLSVTQRLGPFWLKTQRFEQFLSKLSVLTFLLKTQRFEQFPSKPAAKSLTRHGNSMKHYPKPSFLSRALLFGRNNSAFGTIFQ